MTLNEYITEKGIKTVAEQIGVDEVAVYYWKIYVTAPKPHNAKRLIKVSKGALSWQSIYEPFVKNNNENQTYLKIKSK